VVLSIIICTYNRHDFLKKCLESVLEQTKKSTTELEIIIVDNNSNDKTDILIKSFKKKYENIIYLLEKKQGLSYARNLGVHMSKGDYLAFIDDDAVINPNWLNTLLYSIQNIKAEVFGGPIYPYFENKLPCWIDPEYFVRTFKKQDGYLNILKSKFGFSGGNMCIKRTVFDEIGSFNTNLGMIGDNLGLGEESDFFYRIYTNLSNVKLYNLKEMSITHFEGNFKFKKEYLRKRILLSSKQFANHHLVSNKFKGYIFICAKIIKQSIDLILNTICPKFIMKYNKFNKLKSYSIIKGLLMVLLTKNKKNLNLFINLFLVYF